jgi:MFS transporter, PAT family, beta-lactamase induction signal transducer AmpG
MSISPEVSTQRRSRLDSIAVYLRPRVLVVLFLGFSSGLPLALSGSTLFFWMREAGVDLRAIGLFALVAAPYTFKFLWAPVVDALDVPVLSPLFGRRRSWLLLSQFLLAITILILGLCDPSSSPWSVALAALLVATASATQDIIIDAFRVESLSESEQAAGMASYVAAYRIGMLVSGAGALYLVSRMEELGFGQHGAWALAYAVMAGFVLIGVATTLWATEPEKSATANVDHALHAKQSALQRVADEAIHAFSEFLTRDLAFVALAFVVLFKLTDAYSVAMTPSFAVDIGVSRDQYATIVKFVGTAAILVGGFAGGFIARGYSLTTSLWIGGILQSVANLAFSWLAVVGASTAALTLAVTAENFTGAIGTVIFVAYLSALCKNPLYTATQFALLTALSTVGRTFLSLSAGYVASKTGWFWFWCVCAGLGIPSLVMLAYLQRRGHFIELDDRRAC